MIMPATVKTYEHGHTSVLDYTIEWTKWLNSDDGIDDADSLVDAQWVVDGDLLIGDGTNGAPAPTVFSRTIRSELRWFTKVWLGAGTLGTEQNLTVRVSTLLGREEERSFLISLVDK